jgi:hypothetical protein
MSMRPKHPLVRPQSLNVSGDLMGSFTPPSPCKTEPHGDVRRRAFGPVTSFLFFRYRLQDFQVAAEAHIKMQ